MAGQIDYGSDELPLDKPSTITDYRRISWSLNSLPLDDILPLIINAAAFPSNNAVDTIRCRSPPYGVVKKDRECLSVVCHKRPILWLALVSRNWFRLAAPLLYRDIAINIPNPNNDLPILNILQLLSNPIQPEVFFSCDIPLPNANFFVKRLEIKIHCYMDYFYEPITSLISVCNNLFYLKLEITLVHYLAGESFRDLLAFVRDGHLPSHLSKFVLKCRDGPNVYIDPPLMLAPFQNLRVLVFQEHTVLSYSSFGITDTPICLPDIPIDTNLPLISSLPELHTLVLKNATAGTYKSFDGISMPNLVHLKLEEDTWRSRSNDSEQDTIAANKAGLRGLLSFLSSRGNKIRQLQLHSRMSYKLLSSLLTKCPLLVDLHVDIGAIVSHGHVLNHKTLETLSVSEVRRRGGYSRFNDLYRFLKEKTSYPSLRMIFITDSVWGTELDNLLLEDLKQDRNAWEDIFSARKVKVIDEMLHREPIEWRVDESLPVDDDIGRHDWMMNNEMDSMENNCYGLESIQWETNWSRQQLDEEIVPETAKDDDIKYQLGKFDLDHDLKYILDFSV